jgi:hypothetical protein
MKQLIHIKLILLLFICSSGIEARTNHGRNEGVDLIQISLAEQEQEPTSLKGIMKSRNTGEQGQICLVERETKSFDSLHQRIHFARADIESNFCSHHKVKPSICR